MANESRKDLEYKKFIHTRDGVAVKIARATGNPTDDLPGTVKDREYQKFVETRDGTAILVYDPDGGGGTPGGGIEWYEQTILNGADDLNIDDVDLDSQFETIARVKFYSQRVTDTTKKIAYQEFFIMWDGVEWLWFANYFKGMVGGWDGLSFTVLTDGTAARLLYSSNTLDGVYDDALSNMNYTIEVVT